MGGNGYSYSLGGGDGFTSVYLTSNPSYIHQICMEFLHVNHTSVKWFKIFLIKTQLLGPAIWSLGLRVWVPSPYTERTTTPSPELHGDNTCITRKVLSPWLDTWFRFWLLILFTEPKDLLNTTYL